MKSKRTNRFAHLIFIGPAFFFYTMFWIIPTLVAIWISFTRWNGISWAHIKWTGFSNYLKLFNDRFFFTALQNNLLFVFVCVSIIFFTALAIALILNLTMILIGYYVAKIFASGIPQRKCISLECGLQNGTLAVFVATQLFDDIIFMVPTAAYAIIMFVTSIFFVLIVRKIN